MKTQDTVQWGSTFRFINEMDSPFTSLDEVVVNPDVVTITFTPFGGTAVTYTYTNGATPPDPDYMINQLVLPVATITPRFPVAGQVGIITTEPNNVIVGQAVTLSGISPSGYNGQFMVARVLSGGGFSVTNSTITTPTFSSATVTVNGVYYEDVDTTAYSTGVWTYYIEGAPGTSNLDTTRTKVRSRIKSLIVE